MTIMNHMKIVDKMSSNIQTQNETKEKKKKLNQTTLLNGFATDRLTLYRRTKCLPIF